MIVNKGRQQLQQRVKIFFNELARNPWEYGNTIVDIDNKIDYEAPFVWVRRKDGRCSLIALFRDGRIIWLALSKKYIKMSLHKPILADIPSKPKSRFEACRLLIAKNHEHAV